MTKVFQILTLFLFFFIDCGCNLSPSAMKKRRQRQNKSQEQAALARKRDRISKMNQRQAETEEQAALARERDRISKMNQRQAETEEQAALAREKHRLAMKNQRQAETEEQAALAREKHRLAMKNQRQAETEEQAALARERDRISKMNQRQAETEEQAALAREKDKLRKSRSENQDGDMENVINHSMKESLKYLHRTKDPENPLKHRAIVCIICDRFIIGIEAIHKLTKEQILLHERRLSVASYEEYYETKLKSEVTKQYEVNGLKGMLLSPRSRRYCNGYATCTVCNSGMQASMASKKTPPKFAIANGFVIGSFPRVIQFINKEDEVVKRKIEEYELTDLVKAMAAPIRPYGCVFAYSGGAQKSLRGNYQFFEMDHNRLGGVMNRLNQQGISEHIYCVLCGRMTPDQKQIVRTRAKVDTQLFIDVMTWFIKESGHPGYKETLIPQNCTQPTFIEDSETGNNTDHPVNKSVYDSTDRFAFAIMKRCAPTLLALGGTYANKVELQVENILPFAFPFGIGGPKMNRRVKVSLELCIQLYFRLSLSQFMEGPTILVMNHIYNRHMSYMSGVMTCRSSVDGIPLGDKLSILSTGDFEKIDEHNFDTLDSNTKAFLKAVQTSCKSVGHSEEAAKYARRKCFAMLDLFGPNSLFITTTPDDECSFRVRLYTKPQNWVSLQN